MLHCMRVDTLNNLYLDWGGESILSVLFGSYTVEQSMCIRFIFIPKFAT
jgi:hypothetical protein